MLILASSSATRCAMLRAAGVPFETQPPGVDEDEVKAALKADGVEEPARIADALAEHKALRISRRFPDALVLGADQVLAMPDGGTFDKPADLADAARQLRALRGREHRLLAAAALARGGEILWRTLDEARLTVRDFSDAFLERYLAVSGADILASVGAYRIEELGSQLFARVDGDHFTVRGLPLLPVLDQLRGHGLLAR